MRIKLWRALASVMLVSLLVIIYKASFSTNVQSAYVLKGDESPLLRFIVQHLLDSSGGVYTNLRSDLPSIENMASGHQMLSESTGLFMLAAVKQNRPDLFNRQYSFLTQHLLKDGGIRWVVDRETRNVANSNATVDDLLIIRSLLLAAERWNQQEYAEKAEQIADSLLQGARSGSILADFYDLKTHTKAETVTASYLDLYTLKLLAERSGQWESLYNNAKHMLDSSSLGNGLYYKTFDLTSRTWQKQNEFNSIDFLYTALHSAEDHGDVQPTIDFIKRQWKKNNKLGNSYSITGQEISHDESPAVYSLAYRLLLQTGQEELLADDLYQRMMRLSIEDSASVYYGGFVDLNTKEAFSFDHLQALLAETERNFLK
jgi:hypothetical protein